MAGDHTAFIAPRADAPHPRRKPSPHFVTPEMTAEANRLAAEALQDDRFARSLERMGRDYFAAAKRLRDEAEARRIRLRSLLLGPDAEAGGGA